MKPFQNHLYATKWIIEVLDPALRARGLMAIADELSQVLEGRGASTGLEACGMISHGLQDFLKAHSSKLTPDELIRVQAAQQAYFKIGSSHASDDDTFPPDVVDWDA